ncbi:MAG TPA: outer membrane beta-barrel protein [Chryseolinea sp.]
MKDAFSGAEASPTETVWTNIELDLERAEGDKMRRRIVFYKLVAAASVAFAMCMAGLGYYTVTKNESGVGGNDLSINTTQRPSGTEEKMSSDKTISESVEISDNQKNISELGNENGNGPLTAAEERDAAFTSETSRDGDVLIAQAKKNTPAKKEIREHQAVVKSQTINDKDQTASESVQLAQPGLASVDASQKTNHGVGDPKTGVAGSKANDSRTTGENTVSSDKSSSLALLGTTQIFDYKNVTIDNSASQKIAESDVSSEQNQALVASGVALNGYKPFVFNERNLPPFYKMNSPKLKLPDNQIDPGEKMLRELKLKEEAYAKEDKKEKQQQSEKLWTSLGFAAGGFNSLNSSVSSSTSASLAASNSPASNGSNVADKQAKASGVAYSVGVSMGAKLSKRWLIQGGVNYLTQSSNYTANSVVVSDNFQSLKAESINASYGDITQQSQSADANARNKNAGTFPYSVNNNVQFVSVPVQAGYLVINRKFGLQLNAGLSTDLFLQNTITPEGGSLDKTTQGRGDDSPYRSVNFSGLMGTELSYKFGQRYRLALNPGLRYPINSVYKSDIGIQSTPLTFDVGLRFRYIFR